MLEKIRRLLFRVPSFPKGKWFNTRKADIKGSCVVLFFNFTNPASMKALSLVKEILQKYDVSVIGVYVPVYEFESYSFVMGQMNRFDIHFAVFYDNKKKYWRSAGDGVLPWIALVNNERKIVYEHRAEIRQKDILAALTEMLRDEGHDVEIEYSGLGGGHFNLREEYAGNRFSFLKPHVHFYADKPLLSNKHIYVYGRWIQQHDFLRHAERRQGMLWMTFKAGEVYALIETDETVNVEVDGRVLRRFRGSDVRVVRGKSCIKPGKGLYHLYSNKKEDFHKLKFIAAKGTLKVYSIYLL